MIQLLMLAFAGFAGADDLCVPGFNVTPKKTITVPNGISYFIRSVPGAREVSFGSLEKHTPSQILNVDTELVTPVDGDVDPVLTPDGNVLTIPTGLMVDGQTGTKRVATKADEVLPKYVMKQGVVYETSNEAKVMALKEEDLRRKKLDYAYPAMVFYARKPGGGFKMIHSVPDNTANYQSLGTLPGAGPDRHYRMLFKGDQVEYQDYAYDGTKQTIEPLGARRTACPAAVSNDMPMLAKDGQSFSGYVEAEQVVRIYEFDAAGGCRPRDTLPSMTGKVDFSPNGKLLAFQLDEAALPGQSGKREFERPSKDQKLRAYVYDRESKRLTAVSTETNGHTYFPVFMSDTEIAYAHAVDDEAVETMQIKLVNLAKTEVAPASCPTCAGTARLRQASALVARLYAARCNPLTFAFDDADRTLTWLTPQTCEKLVGSTPASTLRELKSAPVEPGRPAANTWNPGILKKLTKADLIDVCHHIKVPVAGESGATKSGR